MEIRLLAASEWDEVAKLIHASLNEWYKKNRGFELVPGPWETMRLFPRVYEALDPNCCVVAVDTDSATGQKRIAGSCFYHPRPTHLSLGIMNVHPDYFGKKIAPQLLKYVTNIADSEGKVVRLVSSAMNLDSFSLYNKGGFVPQTFYQDMILTVPANITVPCPANMRLRAATLDDLPKLVTLDTSIAQMNRQKDLRFFIENMDGIWSLSLMESETGDVVGFLASVNDPGSNMIGPGLATTEDIAESLLLYELSKHTGRRPVILVPSVCRKLTSRLYSLGATNCETHIYQIRPVTTTDGTSDGTCSKTVPPMTGVMFPTFMPETG